jgi:hypothetical protein
MADPVTALRSCILLVQMIGQLQSDFEQNKSDVQRLINRIKTMDVTLNILQQKDQYELSAKREPLNHLLSTLNEVCPNY